MFNNPLNFIDCYLKDSNLLLNLSFYFNSLQRCYVENLVIYFLIRKDLKTLLTVTWADFRAVVAYNEL